MSAAAKETRVEAMLFNALDRARRACWARGIHGELEVQASTIVSIGITSEIESVDEETSSLAREAIEAEKRTGRISKFTNRFTFNNLLDKLLRSMFAAARSMAVNMTKRKIKGAVSVGGELSFLKVGVSLSLTVPAEEIEEIAEMQEFPDLEVGNEAKTD